MDIIIETPKASAVKFKYDEKLQLFKLLKKLPVGLVFPYDFGFIPNTTGEDGDPLDVMVLSEFQGFPGCVMDVRIIGSIPVLQHKGKKMIRNDRFLAIPEVSDSFSQVHDINDLPPTTISGIVSFFKSYLEQQGIDAKFSPPLNALEAITQIKQQQNE